jgi:hypothetical protein
MSRPTRTSKPGAVLRLHRFYWSHRPAVPTAMYRSSSDFVKHIQRHFSEGNSRKRSIFYLYIIIILVSGQDEGFFVGHLSPL